MARYVVIGAGAVGGTIGGRLVAAGRDVALVARGAHGEAIRAGGLLLRDPEQERRIDVPCAPTPHEVAWGDDDVVVLATKVHQAGAALDALRDALATARVGPVPVVCATNGIEAERLALRHFPAVHGMLVVLPAEHLVPGVVTAYAAPPGVLDLGRYPTGADAVTDAVAADLTAAGFSSRADADIMQQKRSKLLSNLANTLEAACGVGADVADLAAAARAEAREVLRTAGLAWAPSDEARGRREASGMRILPVGGHHREGGSTWQSLVRSAGDTEADFLNGEIVLLGRLHGVPTPVNEMLQQVAREMAAAGAPPGSLTPDDLRARRHDRRARPGAAGRSVPAARPTRSALGDALEVGPAG